MNVKNFATRLTERLRKRSEDYRQMYVKSGFTDDKAITTSKALEETADCIEEVLSE